MAEGRLRRWGAGARFLGLTLALIWTTHAIAFFAHEYAHSGAAWLLGYKANPLAIDYGGFNLPNLLFFSQVDENVAYDPIFGQGHGPAAALIAFAGMGIANSLLYLLSRLLLRRESVRDKSLLFHFVFWFCFMNVGNFYDYVPIRTFASHGDMAHIAQGLNISPWAVLIVLGYPTEWAMWHFFARLLPDALPLLAPDSRFRQAVVVIACAAVMFGYFGGSGYFGYGEVSRILSGISILAAPGVAVACWPQQTPRAG